MFGIGNNGVVSLTQNQARLLIDSSTNQHERAALIIGLNSGIALSELLGLCKSDINFSGNTIYIRTRKAQHTIYLTPGAMRELENSRCWRDMHNDYLFQYSVTTFSPVMQRWSSAIGHPVDWRVIRHTYASRAFEEGIPIALAAHNIGTSEKAIALAYALDPVRISKILQEKVLV